MRNHSNGAAGEFLHEAPAGWAWVMAWGRPEVEQNRCHPPMTHTFQTSRKRTYGSNSQNNPGAPRGPRLDATRVHPISKHWSYNCAR